MCPLVKQASSFIHHGLHHQCKCAERKMPITSQFYHENGFDPGFADHTLRNAALEPLPKQDTPGYVHQHGGGCGGGVPIYQNIFKTVLYSELWPVLSQVLKQIFFYEIKGETRWQFLDCTALFFFNALIWQTGASLVARW